MLRRWFSTKKSRVGAFAQKPPPPDAVSLRRRWFQRAVLAGAFLVMAGSMTRLPDRTTGDIAYDIDNQSTAKETIFAAFDFEVEDLKLTREAREAAANAVADTYRVRTERVRRQLEQLSSRIEAVRALHPEVEARVRAALLASDSSQPAPEVASSAVNAFAAELIGDAPFDTIEEPSVLATWLLPDAASLPERVFEGDEAPAPEAPAADAAPRPVVALVPPDQPLTFSQTDLLENLSVGALEHVLASGVREPGITEGVLQERMVLVRDRVVEGLRQSEETTLGAVPGPDAARELLSERLTQSAQQLALTRTDASFPWARFQAAALALSAPLLTPTVQLDEDATEEARQRAWEETAPVMKQRLAGDALQRVGDRWNPQSRHEVRTYWALLQEEREPTLRVLSQAVANMILVVLTLMCLRRALQVFTPLPPRERQQLWNVGLLLMAGTLLLGRVIFYFEASGFLVPAAAAAILYAILGNTRAAALFSLLTAALVSALYGYDWRVFIVHAAMSLAGTFAIYKVRRRNDMTAACIQAGVFGVIAGAAVLMAVGSLSSDAALRQLLVIAFNGMVCLFLVPGLLPSLERLFGVTTDIQLLEYSDLNNELLAKLALEVPGTFSHSLMLGQLAEAAAEAIGANGLKARVCAYYHDIGKMRRPAYFSENQAGFNIHDELTPRLSARAIASHVTAGVEIAKEYHLPKPIIDGIREHHGTTLISFFFMQAKDQQKHGDVREEDFRYPGPRPQSRETAILMICDAVESGTRSIKNPNEERVREFVDKIIAARSSDRQFDQCNLTLRELDTIADVVTKRMLGALHGRVAYPSLKPREETETLVGEPRPRNASEPGVVVLPQSGTQA